MHDTLGGAPLFFPFLKNCPFFLPASRPFPSTFPSFYPSSAALLLPPMHMSNQAHPIGSFPRTRGGRKRGRFCHRYEPLLPLSHCTNFFFFRSVSLILSLVLRLHAHYPSLTLPCPAEPHSSHSACPLFVRWALPHQRCATMKGTARTDSLILKFALSDRY